MNAVSCGRLPRIHVVVGDFHVDIRTLLEERREEPLVECDLRTFHHDERFLLRLGYRDGEYGVLKSCRLGPESDFARGLASFSRSIRVSRRASTGVSSTGPETGQCILPISGATDSRRMIPGDSSICDVISRWLDMLSCRSFAASFPISSTIWLIRVIEGSM